MSVPHFILLLNTPPPLVVIAMILSFVYLYLIGTVHHMFSVIVFNFYYRLLVQLLVVDMAAHSLLVVVNLGLDVAADLSIHIY